MHDLGVGVVGLARHAELVQADHRLALVEQTHDDLLTEHGGDRRDAHVERATVDLGRELAVLRSTLLDDVHVRHDLEAADERVVSCHRQSHCLDQLTVDAVSNSYLFVEWLDVDVGGTVA